MSTFFAVANVNGPISVEIEASDIDDAIRQFSELDTQAAIDDARTDAEDALDIDGADMTEDEFDAALTAAGCEPRRDLNPIHNAHAGTTAHLAGGWYLWEQV